MQWKANWIWIKGEEKPRNFYLCARKILELNKKAKRVTAFVSADSRYKLYVNGKFVGRGGAKCDPKFQYYDVHDLTKILRRGKNVIAAIVYHYGDETFSYHSNETKTDFSNWVRDVIGDEKLSRNLLKSTTRAQAAKSVANRVAWLKTRT